MVVGRTKRRSARACILRYHAATVTIVHHLRVLVVASHLRSLSLSRSQDLKSCDRYFMVCFRPWFQIRCIFAFPIHSMLATTGSVLFPPENAAHIPPLPLLRPFPIQSRFASTCSRTSRPLCHHPMTRIIDFCCLLLTPHHFLVLLV